MFPTSAAVTTVSSPNTVYVPPHLHINLSAPLLSSPPRRLPQNLKRRSRVTRTSSARAKQLQVLPELSEVDESSCETEISQSDSGFCSDASDSRPSKKRPRPVGITQASDLPLATELALVRNSREHRVLVRSPAPVPDVEHSATLSFIAHYDDNGEEQEVGYQLEFPRPPLTGLSYRSSPTPSLDSLSSGSSESPQQSRANSPNPHLSQRGMSTPSPLKLEAWNDGLDELWSEIDAMLEWDPNSANFPPLSPSWSVFPETPSPLRQQSIPNSPESTNSRRNLSLPRPFSSEKANRGKSAFAIPNYPPPVPPKGDACTPAAFHSEFERPPPRTPLPMDVDGSLSPTASMILTPLPPNMAAEPGSRFSISTIDSPIFSPLTRFRLSRARSQSSSGSDSGCGQSICSGCSSSSTGSGGLKRKPIPIELFIR